MHVNFSNKKIFYKFFFDIKHTYFRLESQNFNYNILNNLLIFDFKNTYNIN